VRDAVERGARIVVGGTRLPMLGRNYYAPTLLIGADASMACSCGETFGPVVPVTRFEREDDAIAAANGTPYGLAAYFYSGDARRIARVADALQAGLIGVNEGALAAEAAPVRRREGVGLRARRLRARIGRLPAVQVPEPGAALKPPSSFLARHSLAAWS